VDKKSQGTCSNAVFGNRLGDVLLKIGKIIKVWGMWILNKIVMLHCHAVFLTF
jgi:hypothetical protein